MQLTGQRDRAPTPRSSSGGVSKSSMRLTRSPSGAGDAPRFDNPPAHTPLAGNRLSAGGPANLLLLPDRKLASCYVRSAQFGQVKSGICFYAVGLRTGSTRQSCGVGLQEWLHGAATRAGITSVLYSLGCASSSSRSRRDTDRCGRACARLVGPPGDLHMPVAFSSGFPAWRPCRLGNSHGITACCTLGLFTEPAPEDVFQEEVGDGMSYETGGGPIGARPRDTREVNAVS